jgi:hypothetical protein
MVFETIVQNMQQMGFFQYLFPFLLSLAILYGLLQWALGDKIKSKSALGLVSLILSFFVMLFVSANPGIVTFLMNISGYWLIVGCGLLFVIVLLGFVGIKAESDFITKSKYGQWTLLLVVVLIGILIFFGAGGQALIGMPSWAFSSELWTIVFFVVILAIVLLMMGGEEKAAAPTKGGP